MVDVILNNKIVCGLMRHRFDKTEEVFDATLRKIR